MSASSIGGAEIERRRVLLKTFSGSEVERIGILIGIFRIMDQECRASGTDLEINEKGEDMMGHVSIMSQAICLLVEKVDEGLKMFFQLQCYQDNRQKRA